MKDAISRSLDYMKRFKRFTFNDGKEFYESLGPDADLEELLDEMVDLAEKESKSRVEHARLAMLENLKSAFLGVLNSSSIPREKDDIDSIPERKELAAYFMRHFHDYRQVTVNYDTCLEAILDEFPYPEDHEHQIQHIHGSLDYYYDERKNIVIDNPLRETRSGSFDGLILPIKKKHRLIEKYDFINQKFQVLHKAFQKAEKLIIIGCSLRKYDDELHDLISKAPNNCKICYIYKKGENDKTEIEIDKIFKKQKENGTLVCIDSGFNIGCLDAVNL